MPSFEEIDAKYEKGTSFEDIDAKYESSTEQKSLEDVLATNPAGINPAALFESVEAVGAGVAEGAFNINKAILKGSLGGSEKYNPAGYKKVRKNIDAASEGLRSYSQGYEDKGYGVATGIGNVAGAVAGTPYMNPVFKGMSLLGSKAVQAITPKAFQKSADVVGSGLGTIGSGGIFAGVATGDPNAALEAVTDPMTAGLSFLGGAAASKLPQYIKESESLAKIKGMIPGIAKRQTKEYSAWNNAVSKIFDSIPSLTGGGQLNKLNRSLGNSFENLIKSHYGLKKFKNYDDLRKYTYGKVDDSIKRAQKVNDKAWKKLDLSFPIKESGKLTQNVNAFNALTKELDLPSSTTAAINSLVKKPSPGAITALKKPRSVTAEEVKQAQTQIGRVINNLRDKEESNLYVGEGGLIDSLNKVRRNLLDLMQKSAPESQKSLLGAARQTSADLFEMRANSPLIRKAMNDELAGFDIVEKLIGNTELTAKEQGAMAKFLSGKSKKANQALELMNLVRGLDKGGKLNPETLRQTIRNNARFRNMVDPKFLKTLDGLDPVLQGIYRSQRTGWLVPATIAGTMATGAGLTYGGYEDVGKALMISYPVLATIANHSPLKWAIAGYSKNVPPKTKEHIENFVQQTLMRMGVILGDDGTIMHKDEDK